MRSATVASVLAYLAGSRLLDTEKITLVNKEDGSMNKNNILVVN